MNTNAAEQPGGQAFEARRKKALELVREFDRQARMRPNELRHELMPALQKMLGHAVNNSAWWRDRLKNVTPYLKDASNFNELLDLVPLTTARELSEYSLWMPAWVPGSNATMYGTRMQTQLSAPPIRVLHFAPEFTIRNQAVQLLAATWSKLDYSQPAVHYGPREVERKLESQGVPMVYLGKVGSAQFFNSQQTQAEQLLDALAEQKASVLHTSGSGLLQLLDTQTSSPRKLRIDQVVVSDLLLGSSTRDRVKQTLGARLINHLESDLFGVALLECRAGDHLHPINSHNFIEVLDENNRRVEVGQSGRLTLTSLTNPAFPIFRFEFGLSVEVATGCPKEVAAPSFIVR